jgi:hypothetical protein
LKEKKEEKTVEIPIASQTHMCFSKTCTLPLLWKMADMCHWSYEGINMIWTQSQKLLAKNIERRVL